MNKEKYSHLSSILLQYPQALLAYSGGVDSSLVLAAWVRAQLNIKGSNSRLLAVTFDSPLLPSGELDYAKQIFEKVKGRLMVEQDINQETPSLEHLIIPVDPGSSPQLSSLFQENPVDRCYHCKTYLFGKLKELASRQNLSVILDGGNVDDLSDYRPGQKAAQELGVISPLKDAGLKKDEIRQISLDLELPGSNRPSMACLASRIPHGQPVHEHMLKAIDQAEVLLQTLGFSPVRVRVHGDLARIEVGAGGLPLGNLFAQQLKMELTTKLNELGFRYVTVDLKGYQMGSMNPLDQSAS